MAILLFSISSGINNGIIIPAIFISILIYFLSESNICGSNIAQFYLRDSSAEIISP